MKIEINENNIQIVSDALSNTIEIIRQVSDSRQEVQSDIKKLVLLDLLYRQYPNLNAINLLFNQYFNHNYKGNTLPIGLIMRCSLEDMLFAKYLLSFNTDLVIFENEILVQSKNFISEYLKFLVENESDYWLYSEDKKAELMLSNQHQYEVFKLENPYFFDKFGKVKSFKALRDDIPNIENYFDDISRKKQGPSNMFNRLKKVDQEFSYIYFEYKFYCLLEHYSFHSRKIMALNDLTFGHLTLSIEFMLRAFNDILIYVNVEQNLLTEIRQIKKSLGELLEK